MNIHLEIFPILTMGLSRRGTDRVVMNVTLPAGASIRALFDAALAGNPELARALFEPATGNLKPEIVVSLDEVILPLSSVSDAKLSDGDRVFLLTAMPGG